jgi:hypothetical protein
MSYEKNFKGVLMKSLVFLALTSFSLMAMPKIGDKATYQVSLSGMQFTSSVELVSFDPASNTFVQNTTTDFLGQTNVESETVAMEDLASDEQLDMTLSLCEGSEINGKLETLTVMAGTFSACTIMGEESSSVSMAKVPFGILKMNTLSEGMPVSLELMSFTVGQ